MNRVDWLRVTVLAGLGLGLCVIANAVAWVIEQAIRIFGPWVLAHADAVVGVVLVVCVALLVILAVAEKARKGNPTW